MIRLQRGEKYHSRAFPSRDRWLIPISNFSWRRKNHPQITPITQIFERVGLHLFSQKICVANKQLLVFFLAKIITPTAFANSSPGLLQPWVSVRLVLY